MKCCNCGGELRPRDAEAFDGRALSESSNLGHRDNATCEAINRQTSREIVDAIHQLEIDGVWETVTSEKPENER